MERSTRSASPTVINVPIPVSADFGSPVWIFSTATTSASRKSVAIEGCVITRCTEMHTWPALTYPPIATAAAAASTSASGRTTTGHEAPSSRDSFFTPASWVILFPTPVDPVKETLLTRGSLTNASPSSPPAPVRTDSTPSGSPASTKQAAMASAVNGVARAGFNTTAFPAANAGASLCITSSAG